MTKKVKIYREHENSKIPKYKTEGSAGADIYAIEEVTIQPMQIVLVKTGIYVEIPQGIEMQIRPRSGLSVKHGITLINCVGTVDSDYRGHVGVPLINLGSEPYTIKVGERIAQMIFNKYESIEWEEVESREDLEETERGEGGFGSTGK